ncbi:MAG: cupin domain-containing protein [Halobacteriota archaeon]
MAEKPDRVQSIHYEDIPRGDKLQEFFTHWWNPGEYFGAETVSMSVLHMEPGDGGPMHYHEEPVEEFYVVLSGTAVMETPEESITAETGSITYFPPEARHRPTNPHDETAIVLTYKSVDEEGSNRHRRV